MQLTGIKNKGLSVISDTPKKPSIFDKMIEEYRENSFKSKEVNKLLQCWRSVMVMTNTFNEMSDTFEIVDEEITNYGWKFKLLCPFGLTFDSLENLIPKIRDGLKCSYFLYEVHESREFAFVDVIYSQKLTANAVPFEPHKVNPWEFYCGVSASGKPIVADMITTPHIFLAGQTRRGKNGSMNHGLTSLIYWCKPEEVQIFYYQGAKGDGGFYKNCKHVYAYAQYDLKKLLTMLEHVEKQLDQVRPKLFQDMIDNFLGDNLFAYNRLHSRQQLPYIYVVIDEYLECTVKKGDDPETKKIKYKIEAILTKIAQYGGSLGITYVISHQKPEKDLCPTFLKNMSNTRICFGYDDNVCSRIVLGDDDDSATGLPPRRAIFKVLGKKTMLFTTNLDGKLAYYLRPLQVANKRDLFADLEKLSRNNTVVQQSPQIKDKPEPQEPVDKVIIDETSKPPTMPTNNINTKEENLPAIPVKEPAKKEKEMIEKPENIAENIEKPIENKEIPLINEEKSTKVIDIQPKREENKPKTIKKDKKTKSKEELIEEMLKRIPNYQPFNEEEAKIIEKIKRRNK